MISDLRPLWIVLLERVAADLALRRVLILFSLLSVQTLYRAIRPELLHIAVSHSMSTSRNSVSAFSLTFVTVN